MNILENQLINLSNDAYPFTYSENQHLTPLGETFAKKIYSKTGLDIKLGNGIKSPKCSSISIYLLLQGYTECVFNGVILNCNAQICPFVFKSCPILTVIWDSLSESFEECSMENDLKDYHNIELNISDYNFVMRNAFFKSEYFKITEKEITEKYSDFTFYLRHKQNEQYYLITGDSVDMTKEIPTTVIDTIIKDVQEKIRNRDVLKAFDCLSPAPIIASYNQLKKEGKIAQIMRKDPGFIFHN